MRVGVKRLLSLMMIIAVPFVSAEPISVWQETPFCPSPFPIVTSSAKEIKIVTEPKRQVEQAPVFYGVASWYSESDPFINLHTANGEIFDDSKMACASWDYPFGTRLKITNLRNGKSVICVVNDRGPARRLRRLVDLTLGAFRKISDPRAGLVRVSVTRLKN